MIETQIYISVNRKIDIQTVKELLIRNKIESPIYILEFGEHYKIDFVSDYEQWELDRHICASFPGYELVTELQRGKKEIRLEISRYQSGLSTTDWGVPIDDPLNQTKYLVKATAEKPVSFSSEIQVLFGSEEKTYHVNIIPGINNATQEEGFLLLNEFKQQADPETTDFFADRLYKTDLDAFHRGRDKMESIVNTDYREYQEIKKKERMQREKKPRKLIREFIKSCNSSDLEAILNNLSPEFQFDIRVQLRQKLTVSGTDNFRDYLESSYQELCGRNFKIKSSWSFLQQDVSIELETSTPPKDTEEPVKSYYRIRMRFTLEEDKIARIILER